MSQERLEILLQFFKALANENRLKIFGVLANHERSVEELATLLDLKAPTVSHHLSKLKELGLVAMRADRNDHLYRLNEDNLHTLAKNTLASFTLDKVVNLAEGVEYDLWERKVLDNFLDGGNIKTIPASHKKRLVVLKWLVSYFDEGIQYPEKEVNRIIERHHPDYCTLRREFIINGLMERENDIYWRIKWQMPDIDK